MGRLRKLLRLGAPDDPALARRAREHLEAAQIAMTAAMLAMGRGMVTNSTIKEALEAQKKAWDSVPAEP
jgi:hypothetical protein